MKRRTQMAIVAAVGLMAVPAAGFLKWRAKSAAAFERLAASARSARGSFHAADLAAVPPPVARYFTAVLREGQPFVSAVTLSQQAEFFVGGHWRPLLASQRFTVKPPGFVWDARVRVAPLVPVFVRDSYIEGAGAMRAELLGLYPIVNQAGAPALNAGALLRYLAEAVWFPTALLPRQGVTWQPIDDCSARASITDGLTSVSLEYQFNDAGDVLQMFAPDRPREINGRYEPTPWRVRCTDYQAYDGIRIPVECEVEWQLPGGPLPYWRGRIVDVNYQLASEVSP